MSAHYLLGGVAYPESNGPARRSGRPVVVIDPEDCEQVERVGDDLIREVTKVLELDAEDCRLIRGALPAALRSLLAPRPDEPQGLGAVVEDAEGRTWVRHDNTPGAFPWVRDGCGVKGWSEIAAVRVLSKGWRA